MKSYLVRIIKICAMYYEIVIYTFICSKLLYFNLNERLFSLFIVNMFVKCSYIRLIEGKNGNF